MKIIHLKGFTDEERLSYRDIIHSNVIMAMRAIVSASDKIGVNNIAPENKVFLFYRSTVFLFFF